MSRGQKLNVLFYQSIFLLPQELIFKTKKHVDYG